MKKTIKIFASAMVVGAIVLQGIVSNAKTGASVKPGSNKEIRPFQMQFSENKLIDLKSRILAIQWPEKETVSDQSQGVPLAMRSDFTNF